MHSSLGFCSSSSSRGGPKRQARKVQFSSDHANRSTSPVTTQHQQRPKSSSRGKARPVSCVQLYVCEVCRHSGTQP